MIEYIVYIAYMVSCILFIMGIKKMGKTPTARKGNIISMYGMLLAVVATLLNPAVMDTWTVSSILKNGYFWCLIAVLVGGGIGTYLAKTVKMTGMPEMVASFNGFGGLASLLVAIVEHVKNGGVVLSEVSGISLGLTIMVGGVTFTGSMIAWAKLSRRMKGNPINFAGQNQINILLIVVGVALSILYLNPSIIGLSPSVIIYILIALSLVLGVTFVIPIGGGDMPVIISFLNSLSGIAAAMVGFTINNVVLIVAGCLVGASGVILTVIMCKAMNKKLLKLLFAKPKKASVQAQSSGVQKDPESISPEDAYLMLEAAQSLVFIPGYGMAVAQAQHAVKDLAKALEDNGCEVNFAIHPVAGRMPGHMNVLLAEADIDYDKLKTMDEMNPVMSTQDIAMVIGANDVVNPAAVHNEGSPIYGMPIIQAYEAKNVFVLKRGKGKGYSGLENELFTNDNTLMIYGDAKNTISQLVSEFQNS